jgi:hypothetical protein
MEKLKIGLLLNNKFTSKYIYDLVCWAETQHDIEISHLIITSPQRGSFFKRVLDLKSYKNIRDFISILLFRSIGRVEKIFLKFSVLHEGHLDIFDISKNFKNQFIINSSVQRLDFSYQLPQMEIERIKELDLDLLITTGSEMMRGNILHAARLGVLGIGSAGNKTYCGDSIGFWECYHKYPKTGFTIQSLTGDGARNILLSGFFGTKFLFSLNQASLYKKITPHLRSLLKQVAATGALPEIQIHQPYSGAIFHVPKFSQGIQYILKALFRVGARVIFKLTKYQKKWEISFVPSSWKKAILWKSVKVKAPRGHFWADPFIYEHNGRTYCYVEDYVYKTDRAHISVLEVTDNGAEKIGECIKEPFHLSFPFLFNYAGNLYMSPECSGSRQIRIYKCTGFPLEWKLESIAMDNVAAADTMLFEHAGIWWMLTSIDESESNDYCSELYLFSSNSPIGAEWEPHPENPIRIDSEGGRNAGLLFDDGKIFRLAQRQGYDQYGQGLLMYEIIGLSKTIYSEKLFSEINPYFKEGLLGVHHLSTTGKITVFDHVSRSFAP